MQNIAVECMESKRVSEVDDGTVDSTAYLLLTIANSPADGSERRESVFGFIKNGRNEIRIEMYTPAVN